MIMSTAAITNREVGELLGMTHAGVSRLRSGDRLPSIDIMCEIEKHYQWNIDAQIKARRNGTYATEFEAALTRQHGALLVNSSA
jgi:transcriptional regulator with XRE-family HTH domain